MVCAPGRRRGLLTVAIAACVGLAVAAAALPLGPTPSVAAADAAATVIGAYRARIPELMAEQGIPGLAVALVDGDDVLWVEGFGHTDRDGSPAVTADTIFSVQSMSKLFTATAVMEAVHAGRLDLDEPITTYVPEFTVHSAFEDHPERKITLRTLLSHTAGFTHEADLWWLPQLQLGIAILTNSTDHQLQGDLALSILGDLVHSPSSAYYERLLALPTQGGPFGQDGDYEAPASMAGFIADAARPPSGDEPLRWDGYSGAYRMLTWGVADPTAPPERFLVESGVPFFETTETGTLIRHRLTEIEAGRFIAENGQTLDLTGTIPAWRSIRLVRVPGGPAPWQWGLLGIVALIAAGWLISAVVGWVRRRSRGSPVTVADPVGDRRWHQVTSAVGGLTAILTLATIALIVAAPGLVDTGFLGWLEFALPVRLALHLPVALAILGGFLLVLGVIAWAGQRSPRAISVRYSILSVAAATLVGQLAAWGLIGWGL